jgi:hypothetical protein
VTTAKPRKKWKPLTPSQEFHKAYREYDEWVKKDMLKHAPEIEAMLAEMEANRVKG